MAIHLFIQNSWYGWPQEIAKSEHRGPEAWDHGAGGGWPGVAGDVEGGAETRAVGGDDAGRRAGPLGHQAGQGQLQGGGEGEVRGRAYQEEGDQQEEQPDDGDVTWSQGGNYVCFLDWHEGDFDFTWIQNPVRPVTGNERDGGEGHWHGEEAEADGGHGQGEGLQVHLQGGLHKADGEGGGGGGHEGHGGLRALEDRDHGAEAGVGDLGLRMVCQLLAGDHTEHSWELE